jgi:hypothetical protein
MGGERASTTRMRAAGQICCSCKKLLDRAPWSVVQRYCDSCTEKRTRHKVYMRDRGSVEAHLRAEANAKEMRRLNKRMKDLDAEDAQRRGGLLTKVVRFFSSKHGTR